MKQKGFTLVELLVVVTLIAILAVAVLATLNPIEQRNKAIDASVRNAAGELIRAEERFFATYGCYTWEWDAAAISCDRTIDIVGETLPGTTNLDTLTTTEEIKQNLYDSLVSTASPWDTLTVTEDTGDDTVHVCFAPLSSSYLGLANCDANASCGTGAVTHMCAPDTPIGGQQLDCRGVSITLPRAKADAMFQLIARGVGGQDDVKFAD